LDNFLFFATTRGRVTEGGSRGVVARQATRPGNQAERGSCRGKFF
jgi:hypothetical protein